MMKKFVCWVALWVLVAGASPGLSGEGLQEVLEDVLEAVREKTAKTHSFRANYTETLRNLVFEMDKTKSGYLALRKSEDGKEVLLHMVQKKPYEQHVYVTPELAVRYEPDNKIAHVVRLDPEKERTEISKSMDLLGDPEALQKRYILRLEEDEEVARVRCWKIHLTPLDEEVETDFKEMTLWIDQKLGLPRKVEGLKQDGDEIRIFEFSKIKVNPRLSRKEFIFDPPRGVDIDEMESIQF